MSSTTELQRRDLADEYEHEPVPARARRSLTSIAAVWFGFPMNLGNGLTGATLQGSLGWSAVLGAIIGGILYTGVTIVGIRALSWLGMIAAPLFIVLALVALALGSAGTGNSSGDVMSYQGAGTALSFGTAISIVIAGFADSGTITADFTRWSTSGRSAVAATFTAFPVANFIAYAVGGLVVAVGGSADPATQGGGFLNLLTGHGVALSALAVVFVFINLGSVASHCLYNGAVGWSGITKLGMRPIAIALGIVGLIVAATGVWAYFLDWLNLLGIFVPPIGAVLIVDQLLLRRGSDVALAYRPTAFAAWILGAAAATASHELVPGSIDALVGIVAAAAGYTAMEAVVKYAARRSTTAPAGVRADAA